MFFLQSLLCPVLNLEVQVTTALRLSASTLPPTIMLSSSRASHQPPTARRIMLCKGGSRLGHCITGRLIFHGPWSATALGDVGALSSISTHVLDPSPSYISRSKLTAFPSGRSTRRPLLHVQRPLYFGCMCDLPACLPSSMLDATTGPVRHTNPVVLSSMRRERMARTRPGSHATGTAHRSLDCGTRHVPKP